MEYVVKSVQDMSENEIADMVDYCVSQYVGAICILCGQQITAETVKDTVWGPARSPVHGDCWDMHFGDSRT